MERIKRSYTYSPQKFHRQFIVFHDFDYFDSMDL